MTLIHCDSLSKRGKSGPEDVERKEVRQPAAQEAGAAVVWEGVRQGAPPSVPGGSSAPHLSSQSSVSCEQTLSASPYSGPAHRHTDTGLAVSPCSEGCWHPGMLAWPCALPQGPVLFTGPCALPQSPAPRNAGDSGTYSTLPTLRCCLRRTDATAAHAQRHTHTHPHVYAMCTHTHADMLHLSHVCKALSNVCMYTCMHTHLHTCTQAPCTHVHNTTSREILPEEVPGSGRYALCQTHIRWQQWPFHRCQEPSATQLKAW